MRAKALLGAGIFTYFQRDHTSSATQLRASLELYRTLGNRHGTARALYYLGWRAMDSGALDEARVLVEESAAICRETGDKLWLGWALARLGVIHYWGGDPGAGRALMEQGVGLLREVDDKFGLVWTLCMYAAALIALQEFRLALEAATEVVVRSRELGARRNLCMGLCCVGAVCFQMNDQRGARTSFGEALVIGHDVGEKNDACPVPGLLRYGMWGRREPRASSAAQRRIGGAHRGRRIHLAKAYPDVCGSDDERRKPGTRAGSRRSGMEPGADHAGGGADRPGAEHRASRVNPLDLIDMT